MCYRLYIIIIQNINWFWLKFKDIKECVNETLLEFCWVDRVPDPFNFKASETFKLCE